ncbi:molecular chaperone TorD family protein [Shewanella avicenniae]|uniref:Molecular chaperone TorD family protein n=1 Tax=Shewanella avicenniae TaxID=2814294 RepID=A0ABX7QSF3_9GAMM|nr:molecular chaperone TorD family protein [Shewanella avicenniae]QSX33855.1 molecular chaperone TorD family protein [Shewanella avicenniae]
MNENIALSLKTVAQLLYQYPTVELLSLMNDEMWQEWPTSTSFDKDCISAIAASDRNFTAICSDFTRLFVGPGKKIVYPWSSIHLDQEPLLFGDSTEQWELLCRKNNIEIQQHNNEPSDHFALMLWVIAELSNNADKQQLCSTVIKDFYTPWIPSVLTKIEQKAHSIFYRELAKLAAHYVTLISAQVENTSAKNQVNIECEQLV